MSKSIRQLASALMAPRSSFGFVKSAHRLAIETSARVRREAPDAPWRLCPDSKQAFSKLRRTLEQAVADPPAPRYVVKPRQPPTAGRRPRLLHIIPNVFVGGSTQLVVDLHEHLGHRYEMSVLTAAVPPGGPHRGMNIVQVPLRAPPAMFAAAFAALKPEAVHMHYWGEGDHPWYESALAPVFAAGIPVVQNVNTPVAPFRDPRIGDTVFVSDYVRTTFAPDMAGAQVIHPGIDLSRFTAVEAADADADDTALMVYRLDRDKLGPESIDPAIHAIRLRPRTRVIVVGEGVLLPVFLERAEAAGCRQNIDFRGYVPFDALPAVYAEARVFLAPVLRESFGQVVPFAMARGHAVVGNRVGALAEILGSDETLGGTPEETGRLLARVLGDASERARLGAANLQRVKLYDLDTMVAGYQTIYGRVLG